MRHLTIALLVTASVPCYIAARAGEQSQPARTAAPPAPVVSGALPEDWYDDDEWHLRVRYIITPAETVAYQRLKTARARETFLAEFWERRDPTPGTPANQYREEFERRVAFADAHFTNPNDAPRAGLDTDRGRIYVMFGAPESIIPFPSGAFELWRYAPAVGATEVTFQFSLPPIDSCD